MSDQLVLVTGATGQIARQVVSGLLEAGQRVRTLSRDPHRARAVLGGAVEVVAGEWDDPDVLARATRGVDRVFLAVGSAPDQDTLEGRVVDAAASGGTPHVVKLSTIGADRPAEELVDYRVARWHTAVEARLAASGLPATILRPSAFMTNLLGFAPTIAAENRIHSSAGAGRVGVVDTADVAAIAVAALTRPGHEGKAYLITGPEALSYPEIAAAFAGVLRRPVTHVDVDDTAVAAALAALGMPDWLASLYVEANVLIRRSALDEVGPDHVLAFTGRERGDLRSWIAAHAGAFAAAA